MILLTFITLCREYDFWFIWIQEEVLNTTEMVWRLSVR